MRGGQSLSPSGSGTVCASAYVPPGLPRPRPALVLLLGFRLGSNEAPSSSSPRCTPASGTASCWGSDCPQVKVPRRQGEPWERRKWPCTRDLNTPECGDSCAKHVQLAFLSSSGQCSSFLLPPHDSTLPQTHNHQLSPNRKPCQAARGQGWFHVYTPPPVHDRWLSGGQAQ